MTGNPLTAVRGAAKIYAEDEVVFKRMTRYFSLLLGVGGLLLAIGFVILLPSGSQLSLGDALTFCGLLLTAGSFFANASS
jgi:hypothetical protein